MGEGGFRRKWPFFLSRLNEPSKLPRDISFYGDGVRRTAPVWFVPSNKPTPVCCFWRRAAEKGMCFFVTGSTTVPWRIPVEGVIVMVRALGLRFVTVLLAPMEMRLVKGAGRFPPDKEIWADVKFRTGCLLEYV
jgi:hypothetical protein